MLTFPTHGIVKPLKGVTLNRSRLLGLAAAVLAACGASGAIATAAQADLVGAGSSLIAPLMSQWAQNYGGTGITYGAVGSGAGISQITARTVDFGASDAPLTTDQASACNGCVQIPWALTATAVAYNLNGVNKLKLTPQLISLIYQGKITMWDDARIKKINKGTTLPSLKITPVYRSDGSGDTYAFTDLLSKADPAGWGKSVGFSTQVGFTVGAGGRGNDGVVGLVNSTPGGITYVAASYAIAHQLQVAALGNAAGRFEYPNLNNITAAAASLTSIPANNEMHIVWPSKKYKTAYPLSTFTYAIVPTSSPKAGEIKPFINWALTTGQKWGPALDFVYPMPSAVLAAAQKTVNQIG
jgi:phosphate transport system substrate-binding protein